MFGGLAGERRTGPRGERVVRDVFGTLIALVGLGCLVYAAYMVAVPFGFAAGGVAALIIAWRL